MLIPYQSLRKLFVFENEFPFRLSRVVLQPHIATFQVIADWNDCIAYTTRVTRCAVAVINSLKAEVF